MSSAKMAEWIDVLFGLEAVGDPRHIVLNKGFDPQLVEKEFDAAFAKLLWPLVCLRAGAGRQKADNDNGGCVVNPISQLQELIQKKRWPPPVYEFTDEFGPLHARSHTCTIHLLDKCLPGKQPGRDLTCIVE